MKTVIEMAREAGWRDLRDYDSEMHEDIFMGSVDSLKAFAELVRADQRKRFRIDDLEMLLKVRAEQIVSLQDEIRNLTGEE